MDVSRNQLELLLWLCLVYVTWGLTDSIQAPFYPIEAESKGATSSEYGLVFGIIHLAMFFAGPIFGRYMAVLRVKAVFIFGVLGTAVCALLFGFLTFIPSKWGFLGFSYAIRIVEGIAEAGAWSAILTILVSEFPDRIASVYAWTEASFGFAEILGPTVGALLFETGGFVLPFELCGGLALVIGVITIIRLPRLLSGDIVSHGSASNNITFSSALHLLKSPGVLVALLGTVYGAVCQGFIETFLVEYLSQFGLSISVIGVSFLAMSIPYMFAMPAWGYLSDTGWLDPEYISPIGNILIFLSYLYIGPATYFSFSPDYATTELGLTLIGLGTAATLTATFAMAQKNALMAMEGPPGDCYSLISGLWTSAFALGNFIGPTLGGPLVDWLGFTGTTPILQLISVAMLMADICIIVYTNQNNPTIKMRRKDANSNMEKDLYERIE